MSLYFAQQVKFVLRFAFAVPVIKFDFLHELLYSYLHLILRLSAGFETYLAFRTHLTFLQFEGLQVHRADSRIRLTFLPFEGGVVGTYSGFPGRGLAPNPLFGGKVKSGPKSSMIGTFAGILY